MALSAELARGFVAGLLAHSVTEEVQLVWTDPSSATVPVRSMAAVLEDLITEAKAELVIMTYSARRYEPVRLRWLGQSRAAYESTSLWRHSRVPARQHPVVNLPPLSPDFPA